MKSAARFSAWIAFAALLCFAPSAFGRANVSIQGKNSGISILSSVPTGFLAFTLGPAGNHGIGGNRGGNNGNNGGNGGSQNGCGGQGSNDRAWGGNSGGGCTAVPEGGTALMYLLLAGLCCAGAMVLRSQRNPAMPGTN
jgi:hypothetical protein